jgi:hypothetical protein
MHPPKEEIPLKDGVEALSSPAKGQAETFAPVEEPVSMFPPPSALLPQSVFPPPSSLPPQSVFPPPTAHSPQSVFPPPSAYPPQSVFPPLSVFPPPCSSLSNRVSPLTCNSVNCVCLSNHSLQESTSSATIPLCSGYCGL